MNTAEEFLGVLLKAGHQMHGPPAADGYLHRVKCACKPSGGEDAWYRFRTEPVARGWYGCWRCNPDGEYWQASLGRSLTVDEIKALEEQARLHREEERLRHKEVALKLGAKWNALPDADSSHPYLLRKGVTCAGLKQASYEGLPALVVPLSDFEGRIWSVQYILPAKNKDGRDKFYEYHGRTKGMFFPIGPWRTADHVVITEGFATGCSIHAATQLPVLCAMSAGNLEAVAVDLRAQFPKVRITIAADDDHSTDGNPGVTKATRAALAVSARLAVPVFKIARQQTDFNDLASCESLEMVASQISVAKWPLGWEEHAVKWLSKLRPIQYESIRDGMAKQMGCRLSILDDQVFQSRTVLPMAVKTDAVQDVWPDAVDGASLLEEIASTFRKFIILPEHAPEILATYVLHTHAFSCTAFTPYISITSAVKRCGKTTLLDLLHELVFEGVSTSNMSGAAMFRLIDASRPTLLVDEFDSLHPEAREALRGILNAGFRAGGSVHRCVGDENDVREFLCYCPKVLAGIGKLPDTVTDRSIVISIRRKLKTETVARFRRYSGLEIRRKCARWFADNSLDLEKIEPELPEELNDRQQDVWEPLFAIAERVGGDWPAKLKQAARSLAGTSDVADESLGIELLSDLRAYMDGLPSERPMPSKEIVAYLASIEDGPWVEYGKTRKPINQRQLARLLCAFEISPQSIRCGEETAKGYHRELIREAISRYLGDHPTA